MKFTMDMFDPKTKQLLIGRAGGSSDLGMGVPKDKERHATQAALAQQQGGVRREPVILVKRPDGYDLLEGWHRTIQHFHKYPDGYTGPAYVAVEQGPQGVAEGESNDTAISLSKLGKFHPGADTLAEFVPERATAQYALHPDKWESTFYSLTNKDSDKLKYYGPKKILIPQGTLVGDMAIANKFYRAKTPEEQEQYAELYKASLKPYPVDVSEYRMPELLIPKQGVAEGSDSNLSYQGNCTEDDVIEHIFGDVNNFANMVEEHGDEFTVGDLVVKYDPETDVHSFYYKKQGVAEIINPMTANTSGAGAGMTASYQARENQPIAEGCVVDYMEEVRS
jgi:hypothetical protein